MNVGSGRYHVLTPSVSVFCMLRCSVPMSAGATERARKAAPLPQRRRALEQRARKGVPGTAGVKDEPDPQF